MKKHYLVIPFACAGLTFGQMGRSLDWPTFNNDAQRSGWEKIDSRLTKEEVQKGSVKLLWKMQQKRSPSLMPPVLIGNLIGYRGFKELAFVGGSNDSLYVMDSDLNRLYWQTHLEPVIERPKSTPNCNGAMTAMPTMLSIGFRRPAGPRPAPGATPTAAAPAAPRPNPMFGPRSIYLITSDGLLHRLNVANGSESSIPVQVVPAFSRTSTLNMNDGVIYTTTDRGCGGAPNAVWAIDLNNPDPTAAPAVTTFTTGAGNFLGLGGPVIGNDGTVYVQTGEGQGANSNSVLALDPKTLTVKTSFTDPSAAAPAPKQDLNSATPVVFEHKGRDVIVSVGKDGRLYLNDATSMNAKTPIAQTGKIVDGGIYGGLATYMDGDTRYVLASVWGGKSGVVAYKLDDSGFTQAWMSREMVRPVPPVIAGNIVFALSSGGAHAVLYALDGATGKEMWSSKTEVTAPGNLAAITVANGRIYFTTTDSTLWTYGMPLEW